MHTLRRLGLRAAIAIGLLPLCLAAQTIRHSSGRALPDAIRMDVVVHQVPPEYPFEARRSRITGKGILVGEVDLKSGVVTSVRMEKSTGSRILDQAALSAFRQWRFKPGKVSRFRTPINYTMAN